MSERRLVRELLDELPPGDPEAVRSRRDLRWINFLMGNERWIERSLRRFPAALGGGVCELGAGDGALCGRLARRFPEVAVTGYDLMPRPAGLCKRVRWVQGDALAGVAPGGGVLVMNLFLHHFEGAALERLMGFCRGFEVLLINEPERAVLPHVLGGLMHPWINRVTRHDLHASLRAGFRQGEIPGLLGAGWRCRETTDLRGAVRVQAWRLGEAERA